MLLFFFVSSIAKHNAEFIFFFDEGSFPVFVQRNYANWWRATYNVNWINSTCLMNRWINNSNRTYCSDSFQLWSWQLWKMFSLLPFFDAATINRPTVLFALSHTKSCSLAVCRGSCSQWIIEMRQIYWISRAKMLLCRHSWFLMNKIVFFIQRIQFHSIRFN